jgi:phage-related protein
MKPVIWVGRSKEDLIAFPEEVRREIGYQLEHVQEGVDQQDLDLAHKRFKSIQVKS